MKKINTFARESLLKLISNMDVRPNGLGALSKKFKRHSLPKSISLLKGISKNKFGLVVKEEFPEILYTLPNELDRSKTYQISFSSKSTADNLQYKAVFLDSNKSVIGNLFSLRSPDVGIFSNIFNVPANAKFLKIILNLSSGLVTFENLEFIEVNISNLAKEDAASFSNRHRAIICFPIIDWEYRNQRPQHIMRELAAKGNHVIYLCSRLFGFHQENAWHQNMEDRITKIHLPGNFRLNLYKDNLTERSIQLAYNALMAFILERAFEDVVLVCHLPFWLPLAKKMNEERGYPIIYDCMDDHSGFENNTETMLKLEHELCENSDVLITTSQGLYDKKTKIHPDCHLIRNAGDPRHFSSSENKFEEPILKTDKPVVGYFGAIAEWFDLDAVVNSAKKHPDWEHVLIGHYERETEEVFKNVSNIKLLGEVPYKLLPNYLSSFDVCTIPFKRIPLTEATNPVKIYEYFASGKPVVSRRLPEVELYSDVTYLYETPAEFSLQVENAMAEAVNDPKRKSRKEIALENTWEERGNRFQTILNSLEKKVSIIIVSYESLSFLRKCISSILRNTQYENFEIVVVDNASSAPVVEYLKHLEKNSEKIKLILNNTNRGFAAANNQGLEASKDADFFVLLNNDTVVPEGWLKRLVYYASLKDVGMVGPVTNCIGNEAQIHTTYENLEEMGRISWGLRKQFQGEIFDIKVLAMFCVCFRKEILKKIGYLDESFSIGMFEDDDYAQRIRKMSLRVICAEDVFIHHYGSVSFNQLNKEIYEELFAKNKKIFESKWGTWIPHVAR